MRTYRTVLLLAVLVMVVTPSASATAGPGDTLKVQTFTPGWPVNPGWLSPREGKFWFPTAEKKYEKILLYYTLKCDPAQNPACGEWDYLTYTHLYEYTGVMDSTQLIHPNFIVFGATPDTLQWMHAPLPKLRPRTERTARYNVVSRLDSSVFGAGAQSSTAPFGNVSGDSRTFLLWSRQELEASGFTSDSLTGLRFHVQGQGGSMDRVTIRLRRFTGTGWSDDIPLQRSGFTTVYDAALDLPSNEWMTVRFTQPFLIWGGGVLVEITTVGASAVQVAADPVSSEGFSFASQGDDEFLNFQYRSHVDCGDMPELDNAQAFTLEAWFKPDILRNWSNLIMRSKSNEHRVGIQFGPVDAGTADVYGLVGNGENSHGYTSGKPVAEGAWHHVAMVYDGTANQQTDRLKIYLNGTLQSLKFSGTIPSITTDIEAPFAISGPGTGTMTGGIDEVRVWRSALSAEDIRARMHTRIQPQDPLFSQLVSAWEFNDKSGDIARDLTGAHDGRLAYPQWSRYEGDRPRGFAATARPAIVLERGNVTLTLTERTVIDTTWPAPLMVVRYDDTTRANIPTDTTIVWPTGHSYTLGPDNAILDSVAIPADGMFIKRGHFYYSAPFELRNRWELGRYITPYGIGLSLGEGWTWIWDVTDFAPLLKDSVHLTAGNFQELLDMKFVFIEGTPPRDVVKIENVWNGDFSLKDFETKVAPRSIILDPAASTFKLRTTATGHQFSNATNCAEFCPKIHSVDVDGQTRWRWQIIQECSMNPLHPQGGTWIYARAGWCPGMEAMTKEFELTPFIIGGEVEIDYDSQYDEFGNYVFESQLVSYGDPHHQLDAAIDRIISPSKHELNGRFNPTCGSPRIVIQNRGARDLTSVDISFGYRGGSRRSYTWHGRLPFMEKSDVLLPPMAGALPTGELIFEVELNNPNEGADEYAYNNAQYSYFETVPTHDTHLIVVFRTNNVPGENRYEVLDADGIPVYSRAGFSANTTYRDTLRLVPGCYEFILHDSGEDGIAWWANNDGTGSLQFRLVGAQLWTTMNPDFGKQTRYPFSYSRLVVVDRFADTPSGFDLYPNPVADQLVLNPKLGIGRHARYRVYDLLAHMLLEGALADGANKVDVSTLQAGMYVVNIVEGATILRKARFSVLR